MLRKIQGRKARKLQTELAYTRPYRPTEWLAVHRYQAPVIQDDWSDRGRFSSKERAIRYVAPNLEAQAARSTSLDPEMRPDVHIKAFVPVIFDQLLFKIGKCSQPRPTCITDDRV
jgi:hypothetical protein